MVTTTQPFHNRLTRRGFIAAALGAASLGAQAAFDHSHAGWGALLAQHVVLAPGGYASKVRYAGFAADRAALTRYTTSLSAVSQAEFDAWSSAQRMAFLINAYNAFTVELILSKYPDLKSIRDLGSVFTSPWKQKFFKLLGRESFLDDIEHGMLRKRGVYDDPRVHFAVNCASVGCPMLREEAFVAERLEAQLAQQAERFMADRSRNRWNASAGKLELSRIFDWYGEDFRLGHKGIKSLDDFIARHADRLADGAAERARLRTPPVALSFLEYDWALNDVAR